MNTSAALPLHNPHAPVAHFPTDYKRKRTKKQSDVPMWHIPNSCFKQGSDKRWKQGLYVMEDEAKGM